MINDRMIDLTDDRDFFTMNPLLIVRLPWHRLDDLFDLSNIIPWQVEAYVERAEGIGWCWCCGTALATLPWINNYNLCDVCAEHLDEHCRAKKDIPWEEEKIPDQYNSIFSET